VGLLRVKSEVEKKQKERTLQVRKDRDNSNVNQSLKRLEDAARSTDNTMPAFLECVEAYATVGEISDVLRKVFSTQKEFLVF
jgi:methylmalonyl-CoA mutase N-terminal domain/subunit